MLGKDTIPRKGLHSSGKIDDEEDDEDEDDNDNDSLL